MSLDNFNVVCPTECSLESLNQNKSGYIVETKGEKITKKDKIDIEKRFRSQSWCSEKLIEKEKQDKADYKLTPFHLKRTYGYNPQVPVINLTNYRNCRLFYVAANVGVLYDWDNNEQRLLQGHRHCIYSVATDGEGKWLVTAGSGKDNILTIWDTEKITPVRTYFSPHGDLKISGIAFSVDAKYLLTLAYGDKAYIKWWVWTKAESKEYAILCIDTPKRSIVSMDFNPLNSKQFYITTKQSLIAAVIKPVERLSAYEDRLLLYDYEIKAHNLDILVNIDYGKLNSTIYIPGTYQIITCTSKGYVLIYGPTVNSILQHGDYSITDNIEDLKFIKALKVERYAIQVIKTVDGIIVTGNSGGEVHFYDYQMKLLFWIDDLNIGSIKGISFNITPRKHTIYNKSNLPKACKDCKCSSGKGVQYSKSEKTPFHEYIFKKNLPSDATIDKAPFLLRDFIIYSSCGIGFVELIHNRYTSILKRGGNCACSITVHEEKPIICIGFDTGLIHTINFKLHKIIRETIIPNMKEMLMTQEDGSDKSIKRVASPIDPDERIVSALKFSPSGLQLACGMGNGDLWFLDPTLMDLQITEPHQNTNKQIKEICYSEDSTYLAYSDYGFTVGLYKYNCDTSKWTFIGKHRAHYKPIVSVFFTPEKYDDKCYKLLSFGEDRLMVEYNVGASGDDLLEILSLDRIDQTATPLAVIYWPTPPDILNKRQTVLIANDQYKFKIVNHSTGMTLATYLGSRYEKPIKKVIATPSTDPTLSKAYTHLIFGTRNEIGIQKLPLDGNPYKYNGMLGHPIEIYDMCINCDGTTVFVIGNNDSCCTQWHINYRSVEIAAKSGGERLNPYYCLIENGQQGWLFQEMRDLFYYIQILCQGKFSPAVRTVSDTIPIDTLPDIMRAIGFFPSDYELENLIVEAKYKVYNKEPDAELKFDEFVKLYLNHRPAFGESITDIEQAFKTFALFDAKTESHIMTKHKFKECLTEYGEQFSNTLVTHLMKVLATQVMEDSKRKSFYEDYNEFQDSIIPDNITCDDFIGSMLGIQMNMNGLLEPSVSEQTRVDVSTTSLD